MEINKEWLEDNLKIGNVNVVLPLLVFALKNNKHLSEKESKRAIKFAQKFQSLLNEKTCERIFKDV